MIGTISELTGKNFVYDESVRGKVSVVSPRPVSVDEAYRLFSTVLKVKGFTAGSPEYNVAWKKYSADYEKYSS